MDKRTLKLLLFNKDKKNINETQKVLIALGQDKDIRRVYK